MLVVPNLFHGDQSVFEVRDVPNIREDKSKDLAGGILGENGHVSDGRAPRDLTVGGLEFLLALADVD